MKAKAYVVLTADVPADKRDSASRDYYMNKASFLNDIDGAVNKELLKRDQDLMIVAGFSSLDSANAFLSTELYQKDIFTGMKKYSSKEPVVQVYCVD